MTVTTSITTQQGISVSLTVPTNTASTRRYRIIRRAMLQRALLPTAPASPETIWTRLGSWLRGPSAEELHAHQQVREAMHAEYARHSRLRLDGHPCPMTLPRSAPFLHLP